MTTFSLNFPAESTSKKPYKYDAPRTSKTFSTSGAVRTTPTKKIKLRMRTQVKPQDSGRQPGSGSTK